VIVNDFVHDRETRPVPLGFPELTKDRTTCFAMIPVCQVVVGDANLKRFR